MIQDSGYGNLWFCVADILVYTTWKQEENDN